MLKCTCQRNSKYLNVLIIINITFSVPVYHQNQTWYHHRYHIIITTWFAIIVYDKNTIIIKNVKY